MRYFQPFGVNDPDASYENGNLGLGADGSIPPGEAIEFPQREIVNTILEALFDPSGTDPRQLIKAIRSGRLSTFDDAGTPNHIVIRPLTPFSSLFKGLPFTIFPAFTNTGGVDITVNTLTAAPLLRQDGTALLAGDVQQGRPLQVYHTGTLDGFRILGFAASEVRRLTTAPTVFVRTDGSDANDGTSNDFQHAVRSLDAAYQRVVNGYSSSSTAIKIKLGIPGSYAAPTVQLKSAGTLIIEGDTTAQDSYLLTGTGAPGTNGVLHNSFGTDLTLRGLQVQNNNPSAFNTVTNSSNATLFAEYVTWAGLPGSTGAFAHLYSPDGGQTRIGDGCKIASQMPAFMRTLGGGMTLVGLMRLLGTQNYSYAFAVAEGNGRITVPTGIGAGFDISAATVTGQRYLAATMSSISTFGAGANFFPGNAVGAVSAVQYS